MKQRKFVVVIIMAIFAGTFLTACASAKSAIRDVLLGTEQSSNDEASWEEDVNQKYEAAIRTDNMQLLKESLEDGANINDLNGASPVYYALQKKNLDMAKYLVEQGSDPNWESEKGTTLLMKSMAETVNSYKGDMVLETLLEHGADVNYLNKNGISAIDYAASIGVADLKTIQILTSYGAKVSSATLKAALERGRELEVIEFIVNGLERTSTEFGVSRIVEAALKGDTNTVKELLSKKIDKEDLNYVVIFMTAYGDETVVKEFEEQGIRFELTSGKTKRYQTPYICKYALEAGNIPMVQYFVDRGELDFNQPLGGFDYPANVAIVADQYELVEYMIVHGADITLEEFVTGNIRAAGMNNNTKMIQLLLDNGYDIYRNHGLNYVIYESAMRGNREVLEYLVDNGYDLNYDNSGSTVADSFLHCDLETVKYLVEHGVNINGTNGEGEALHSCIEAGSTEQALYLIEQGIRVDANTKALGTALYVAVEYGNIEVAKVLIQKGVNINESNFGTYPIEIAACSREMLHILIDAGADVNVQSEAYKTTALMAAAYYGNVEGIKMLMEAGADPTTINNDGMTALDEAKARNNIQSASILEQAMENWSSAE